MAFRLRAAFTLVELLVVIAIIALLVAMLLPALARAKGAAKLVKETANAKQLQQAWHNYAQDNKDKAIPGYKHWNWAHTHSSYGGLWLLNREGRLMAGTAMKPWPNQIWPYFNWDMRPLVTDVFGYQVWQDFERRPKFQNPNNAFDVAVGGDTMEAAFNYSTTFGYNTDFVGGNFLRGAFYDFWGTPNTPYATSSSMNARTKKKWYVQSTADFRGTPASLMVYTTSRGYDTMTGQPIPAYYDIFAPSGPRGAGAAVGADWSTWATRRGFDTRATPTGPAPTFGDWGNIDCRYIDKRAVSAFADGHAAALGVDDYYDMRMWSTWATSPTWRWDNAVRSSFVY